MWEKRRRTLIGPWGYLNRKRITKLKADFDSDTPIESYATLKKRQAYLMVGIDWHRLAPRKKCLFCRIKGTYAPINQPNLSNCSSRQELVFQLISEKRIVELRAGG